MVAVQGISVPVSGRQQNKTKTEQTRLVAQQEQTKAQQQAQDAAGAALRGTPGKVLVVPAKGILIVSLGIKHGFKNGDRLKLYEAVDTKDEKGNIVFTEEKFVGEVTIDAVNPESSKVLYSGDKDVKAGWIVKAN